MLCHGRHSVGADPGRIGDLVELLKHVPTGCLNAGVKTPEPPGEDRGDDHQPGSPPRQAEHHRRQCEGRQERHTLAAGENRSPNAEADAHRLTRGHRRRAGPFPAPEQERQRPRQHEKRLAHRQTEVLKHRLQQEGGDREQQHERPREAVPRRAQVPDRARCRSRGEQGEAARDRVCGGEVAAHQPCDTEDQRNDRGELHLDRVAHIPDGAIPFSGNK